MEYKDQVIRTPDGKDWIYDDKHHGWIEVTRPKGFGLVVPIKREDLDLICSRAVSF